jgi:hypothetical protein
MPAAFGRDLRGTGKEIWIGSSETHGKIISQSGIFDYFLCRTHEEATQKADDYAVRFIRGFSLTNAEIAHGRFDRPASDNEMLIRFVCTTLWRFHQSSHSEAEPVDVGAWEPVLRDVTFGGCVEHAPDVYMCAIHQSFYPELSNHAYSNHPRPVERWSRNGIQFTIHGLVFIVKLEPGNWPPNVQSAILNLAPNGIIGAGIWYWREEDIEEMRKAGRMMQTPAAFRLGVAPRPSLPYIRALMVRWPSGEAPDCKSVNGGSIPPRTSRP